MKGTNNFLEIDFVQILNAMLHWTWAIVLAAVIGGGVMFSYAAFFIAPKYQADAMLYVNNSALTVGSTSLSINSAELSAAKSLVETYIVILNSRSVLNEVIETAELNYSCGELKEMISAASVSNTQVFRITVTGTNPKEAEKIANVIVQVLPRKITDIMHGSSVQIVDYAITPTQMVSPDIEKYTVVGVLCGILIACLIIVILLICDTQIHDEDYLMNTYKLPVLAVVPDLFSSKRDVRAGYADEKEKGKRKSKKKRHGGYSAKAGAGERSMEERRQTLGSRLSFGAAEAYKLLRTNLMFSMADEGACKIIGVASALRGEGKSTTSMNLAYTLAQSGERVLLLEADMRIPVMASMLELGDVPGLSHVLAGLHSLQEAIHLSPHVEGVSVMPAGEIPPNPSELLSSKRMGQVVQTLSDDFTYIIVDLPPVNDVSDALAVSKLLSGMIVVVCQEYCDQASLAETMRRMGLLEVKVLGFILNAAESDKKWRGRYGAAYGKDYRYAYAYEYRRKPETSASEEA